MSSSSAPARPAARWPAGSHWPGAGRILVLEAGPRDLNPWLHLPIGYGKTFYHPRVNWMYRTERQYPASPAVRSTSRAARSWAGRARSTRWSICAASPRISTAGSAWAIPAGAGARCSPPIAAWRTTRSAPRPGMAPAAPACRGHRVGGASPDADLRQGGVWKPACPSTPISTAKAARARASTRSRRAAACGNRRRRAYLHPARKTGRVKVETDVLASRILFEGRRAVGVEGLARRPARVKVSARRRDRRRGRRINSPQLLQLSGIGAPDASLRGYGISPVHALPAVGAHLQDHLCYDHVYRSRQPSLNEALLSWVRPRQDGVDISASRSGPLSLSVNQGGGFFKTRPGLDRARHAALLLPAEL
jgi:choline dehydrogenase